MCIRSGGLPADLQGDKILALFEAALLTYLD